MSKEWPVEFTNRVEGSKEILRRREQCWKCGTSHKKRWRAASMVIAGAEGTCDNPDNHTPLFFFHKVPHFERCQDNHAGRRVRETRMQGPCVLINDALQIFSYWKLARS